ncbi:MAG: tetratricopeptide repeat protein [Planctomycetes bacterium]|nr:tetratricopeptide repeat protein [Planctomycetota bacterium]
MLEVRPDPAHRFTSRALAPVLFFLLVQATLAAGEAPREDASKLPLPLKPPGGMLQQITPDTAFVIQTDVSSSYLSNLVTQITTVEGRMFNLFKITPGFLKGNDPKVKLSSKITINGDTLSKWGFKPWIEVRVYKKFEDYVDEHFNESDRLTALVNKTEVKKETNEQRAVRRITEGIPGAYYMRITDYDGKFVDRRIRAYVGPKNPEEVEGDLLHELGHLFLETYLMEFAGAPKKGQEAEKRGTPAWIGEGVAQLFEVNWATSKLSEKKKKQYSAMIYEAVLANDHYPVDEFINVTNAHNLQAIQGNPLKSTINYAQSWSVMQFMVEMKWQAFLQFLENCRTYNMEGLQKGKKISELYSIQERAFKDAFGVPMKDMEEHWKKHVIDTMEKDLKRDPSGYYWCGEYYLRRKSDGYLDKAAERFKKAIDGALDKGEGYLGMGRVDLLKKDVESALKNFKKASELSPKDEDGWYYLGIAQVRAGKSKDAIASFEQAVKLYPLFHQALSGLADAYFSNREFAKAQASYDAAFQISKHPNYLFSIGQAAYFAKNYEEAQKNFAAYSNIFPKAGEGAFWYGLAALRLKQNEFAVKKLTEAVSLDPNDATYKQALAMAQKGEIMRFQAETDDAKSADPKADAGKIKPPTVYDE